MASQVSYPPLYRNADDMNLISKGYILLRETGQGVQCSKQFESGEGIECLGVCALDLAPPLFSQSTATSVRHQTSQLLNTQSICKLYMERKRSLKPFDDYISDKFFYCRQLLKKYNDLWEFFKEYIYVFFNISNDFRLEEINCHDSFLSIYFNHKDSEFSLLILNDHRFNEKILHPLLM